MTRQLARAALLLLYPARLFAADTTVLQCECESRAAGALRSLGAPAASPLRRAA